MTPKELKRWRTKHGLTQPELAALCGYQTGHIWRMENGVRKISRRMQLEMEKLMKSLGRG